MPKTLIRIFIDAVARQSPAMFMRKSGQTWESISAQRAWSDVESLGLGLRGLGVERGDRVAILSENRYEWPVSDLAILGLGAVSVPIYPTLIAQQIRYILENAEVKVVIVSTPAQLDKLQEIAGSLPALKTIVAMEPSPPLGGGAVSFETLIERGAAAKPAAPNAFRQSADQVKLEDIATIIYTSGTTGDPKGAMLRHSNIGSNVEDALVGFPFDEHSRSLSFLPLCHIFERMAGLYSMLAAGCTIAYAQSIDTVAQDAAEVRPTVLMGVPRFFEKVHARVLENASTQPPLRRSIFFWGLEQGRRAARARFEGRTPGPWPSLTSALADRLVGAKVRGRIGGRIQFCISGGAPLSGKIMEFFAAMGIPIHEGYGLTETSPVICVNPFGRARPGSVGPPIRNVEVRIGEEGEILTRGPHVMAGYFRNDAATAAAIRDGWFHTGDVGHLKDGYMYITDRLKDLLVTSGGKKIAPQPLEEILKRTKWVTEAVLLGDQRPYVVALLVPNYPLLEAEAKAKGWSAGSRAELLRHAEVRALYQREIDGMNEGLSQFEKVKKFTLLERELSQEAGELTPTLKVRRRIVTQKFADRIEAMYAVAP